MRLTAIAMQEAVPPDSRELDLSKYEGEAIMVQGRASSGWVYSAAVIDRAGPILSLLVQKEFSVEEKPSTRRAKGTPEKGTK
jgi:hypothetical protein